MPHKGLLARDIYELAQWIDADGNQGHYQSYVPEAYRYILNSDFKPYRDGIIYYSKGHGWRVRKKPHWKTVYQERFSQWYSPPQVGAEQKEDNNVTR